MKPCCIGSASAATKHTAATAVILGPSLGEVANAVEVFSHLLWIIPRELECSVFKDMHQSIGILE
jgi:hypothetical protein